MARGFLCATLGLMVFAVPLVATEIVEVRWEPDLGAIHIPLAEWTLEA